MPTREFFHRGPPPLGLHIQDSTSPVSDQIASQDVPPHQVSRVLAGGLFALFFGSLIQALTLFGVITVNSGHLFMFVAFVAGSLMIATEILPLKPTRHKVASIVGLFGTLLVIDVACAIYGQTQSPPHESASVQSPEASTATRPSAISPVSSPAVTPTARPTPTTDPALIDHVPRNFDRLVFLKGGQTHRLDVLLREAGYKGSMSLQALYFRNLDENTESLYWGQPDLDPASAPSILPGDGYNFPRGANAEQVGLFAKKDMKVMVSLRSQ
jgi:hypothetical protein